MRKDLKLYYTFSDIAKELNLDFATLRIWEREFELKSTQASPRGTKRFHKSEMERIRLIYYWVVERQFSFDVCKQKLLPSNIKPNEIPLLNSEVKAKLLELRQFLVELKNKL